MIKSIMPEDCITETSIPSLSSLTEHAVKLQIPLGMNSILSLLEADYLFAPVNLLTTKINGQKQRKGRIFVPCLCIYLSLDLLLL